MQIEANPMLIDVREFPEFAAGHIPGSTLVPLSRIEKELSAWDKTKPITLVCKSGKRSDKAHSILLAAGFADVSVIPGGVDAWLAQGKPLQQAKRRPWSLERQVRIVAGSLVLATMALGFGVSPYFFAGTAFVGAGLIFAGVSDICMMATFLGKMPWNRAQG